MRRPSISLALLLAPAAMFVPHAAAAQILVSANDGKPIRPEDTAATAVPDELAVFAWGRGTIRRVGSVRVPASMTGPPESVKLTSDDHWAVVTSAQMLNPAPPPLVVPGGAVSLVDLSRPAAPRLVETLQVGSGASGVAIDRSGRRVLVASAIAGSVAAFRLAGGHLVPDGVVALLPGSRPVSVRFARKGDAAYVLGAGSGRLYRLNRRGQGWSLDARDSATGRGGSGIALSPDGRTLYLGNAEAGGSVAAVDTATLTLLGTTPLGGTVEHVALSPSGRFLEVTQLMGSNLAPSDANYRPHGRMTVLRVQGRLPTPLAEVETEALCQGAAWSDDETTIALQCAGPRAVYLYRFDGARLSSQPVAVLPQAGRPGAMATARTR